MPEHVVVVVGSNASLPEFTQGQFWVIDFSSAPAGAPTAVPVTTTTGVVVDCSGTLAAVATTTPPFAGSTTVTIYDVSNPATPRSIGSATLTSFGGISAISFYGGYVLAAEANGSHVALIDINDLDNPQTYPTDFDTVTDVTLFGSTAIVCGISGSFNAFLVVNSGNLSSLSPTVGLGATNVSPYNGDAYTSLMCDFDGTNAVFSDGLGLYAFNVSGGTPTALSSFPALATSVAIAESGNSSGLPTGGVQVAYTAAGDANVELQYVAPPVPPGTNWSGSNASLGDPNNIYGQPNAMNGGVAKFSRSIWGTSALLAAAGVTETSGGAQEYVVSLFDLSAGGGSIQAMRQGARIPVSLATTDTPNSTLGLTAFFTFPRWFPPPMPPWPWLRSIGLG